MFADDLFRILEI